MPTTQNHSLDTSSPVEDFRRPAKGPVVTPKGWLPDPVKRYSDATPKQLLDRLRKVAPNDLVEECESHMDWVPMLPVTDETRMQVLAEVQETVEEFEYSAAVRTLEGQNKEFDRAAQHQLEMFAKHQEAKMDGQPMAGGLRTSHSTRLKKAWVDASGEVQAPEAITAMYRDNFGNAVRILACED